MAFVFLISSVLLSQALDLTAGLNSVRNVLNTSKTEAVKHLKNVHLEKEVNVVRDLDFEGGKQEGKVTTLEKHQNFREFEIKTQMIETKDTLEILEVAGVVKLEKTNMEQESGDLDVEHNMGTQVLNDRDESEEKEDESEECRKTWWCSAAFQAIHTFVIPVISLCGFLGWCFWIGNFKCFILGNCLCLATLPRLSHLTPSLKTLLLSLVRTTSQIRFTLFEFIEPF